jgi:U3 small nucleolar RNA-associated protein 5
MGSQDRKSDTVGNAIARQQHGRAYCYRFIMLADPGINILAPSHTPHVETSTSSDSSSPQVICASATPYSINFTSSTERRIDRFDSFKNAIHTIIRSGNEGSNSSGLFLAADSDRYINLYDIGQKRLSRTLVANSGVDALSVSALGNEKDRSPVPLLAVTTEAGIVELFSDPFQQPPDQAELNSIKSKRKGLTRKASASIKLIRPDREGVVVPIFQALVQGPDVVIASTDGGVDVSFQKVRWQDEGTGELLFDGTREVFRNKSASSLNTAAMNGVKDVGRVHVDESKAVIVDAGAQGTSRDAVIEISSGEGEDSEDAEEESGADARDEDDDDSGQEDTDMADPGDALRDHQEQTRDKAEPEVEDGSAEPTFGERLAARNPDTISIADALVPSASSTLVATRQEKNLTIPSGVSLSTVLTQSLRTNDQNLLESCFHTTDLNTIRLTIQRLDSSLAGVLIQKLAERLSSRPGRYGHLLVWVQWTCIAHGGAIAGRPEIASKIKALYKVLNERSQNLDSLLLLKGKLDMLDAQLTLRRQLQADRGPTRDPDDEDDIIYIEGQEEDFSSDEDETAETAARVTQSRPPKKALPDLIEEEAESEDDEDMPLTNGIQHSDDDDDDDDDDAYSDEEAVEGENGGLVDDEALESNEDSHPSDQEEESEEEDEDVDTEEVDSEMDSFINDGSIEVESESDIDVDDTPEKPPSKKTKRA